MKLSIVIVNWNTADLLLKCLASIYNQPPAFDFEVIVVDNASNDGSAMAVEKHYPQVDLIKSPDNLGFGPGNNCGLKNARGEFILLLNPDTELNPGALEATTAFIESDQTLGVVGIKQREPSGKLQESCGHFPSITTMGMQAAISLMIKGGFKSTAKAMSRAVGFKWMPVHALYPHFDFDMTHDVDWVMGAFMMTRRTALADANGGFDPEFVMYAEEIDLCFRIKAKGWKIAFFPGAEVMHYGGASTQSISLRADAMRCVAMIRFYRKHRSVLSTLAYRVLIFITSLLNFARQSGTRRDLARLKMSAALNPTYEGLFNLRSQR